MLAGVAAAFTELARVRALHGKGGAARCHGPPHIVAGGAVVAVMTGGADSDAALQCLVDGALSGLHHASIAETTIAADEDRVV